LTSVLHHQSEHQPYLKIRPLNVKYPSSLSHSVGGSDANVEIVCHQLVAFSNSRVAGLTGLEQKPELQQLPRRRLLLAELVHHPSAYFRPAEPLCESILLANVVLGHTIAPRD